MEYQSSEFISATEAVHDLLMQSNMGNRECFPRSSDPRKIRDLLVVLNSQIRSFVPNAKIPTVLCILRCIAFHYPEIQHLIDILPSSCLASRKVWFCSVDGIRIFVEYGEAIQLMLFASPMPIKWGCAGTTASNFADYLSGKLKYEKVNASLRFEYRSRSPHDRLIKSIDCITSMDSILFTMSYIDMALPPKHRQITRVRLQK